MKYVKRLAKVVLLVCFFYLMFPPTVYAYLDPGTGSLVIQILIGALFGGLVTIKIYWGKIKPLFRKCFSKRKSGKQRED